MSERKPPSQTDLRTVEGRAAVTARGILSAGGPGYLGGRLALPAPTPGGSDVEAYGDTGDDDAGADLPLWEANDRHRVTASEATAGLVRQALSHVPVDESLAAYWNGLHQPPTEYRIDYDRALVTWVLPPWVRAGDLLTAHYQYTEDAPVEPILLRGYTIGVESITWPAEGRDGDLHVIVVARAPNDSFSDLAGWTHVGSAPQVTHAAFTGTWSATLEVYSKVKQAGDALPTRSDGYGQSIFVVGAFENAAAVATSAFDSAPDNATHTAPTLAGANLRMFVTVSNDGHQALSAGTRLGQVYFPGTQDLDLAVAFVPDGDAVTSDLQGPLGAWSAGSLRLR